MHKLRILVLAGGMTLAAFRPGAAADLGAGGYKDNDYAVAPTTYWQGPYAGVVMGLGGAGLCIQDAARDNPCVGDSSFTGGVLLGYNFRHGAWVGGVEADISVMAVDETKYIAGYGDINVNSNWNGSLRIRAGFVGWDRILFYATGGLGTAEWQIKSPISDRQDAVFIAPTFGLGAEVALDTSWALRGEILMISSGSARMDVNGGKQDVNFGASAVRLGLTRKF